MERQEEKKRCLADRNQAPEQRGRFCGTVAMRPHYEAILLKSKFLLCPLLVV